MLRQVVIVKLVTGKWVMIYLHLEFKPLLVFSIWQSFWLMKFAEEVIILVSKVLRLLLDHLKC
jgi:hypothetical protein